MQSIDLVFIVLAYLIGSIPTAVWVSRRYFNIDIREHGSRNAGATNVMRVLGGKAGIPVLLIDFLKGWVAVSLSIFSTYNQMHNFNTTYEIILGTAAVLGHIFPIFAKFDGGKGVATLAGAVLAINPIPTLIALGVFWLVLLTTKYVSLGSMAGGVSFPFSTLVIISSPGLPMVIFSFAVATLLVATHSKNIKRLINGEERKAGFLDKNRKYR